LLHVVYLTAKPVHTDYMASFMYRNVPNILRALFLDANLDPHK